MPYKPKERVCKYCIGLYWGRPGQDFCSKSCAALDPKGQLVRIKNMLKINLKNGIKISKDYEAIF